MPPRNWINIDAALDQLERLITTAGVWQHDADRLSAIEECLSALNKPNLVADQCDQLRIMAARFYATDALERHRPKEDERLLDAMAICVAAMRQRLEMLKAADKARRPG